MESSSAHGSALEAPASSSHAAAVTPTSVITRPPQAIPSPPSDIASWVPSPRNDIPSSPAQTQTTIRIRDLAHIQSLARTDLLSGGGHGILNDPPLQAMKYEISDMPIGDIIEMVAALLTKITTTNDLQHDALNRNANHVRQAAQQAEGDGQHHQQQMSPLSSSVLAFHGKNVPAITILSYLSRIHKYCPTTYEVFLSLLVYFDRMTERVNDIVMKAEEARRAGRPVTQPSQPQPPPEDDVDMPDDDEALDDDDLADDDDSPEEDVEPRARATSGMASGATTDVAPPPVTFFVVDSFNIHRLIIAGVTCASKFFSDVFYTNSRYAKVGGLPLAELNHLELQFLLLNDFRLAVPVEDLEAYATMLVEFYAREVVSQRSRPAGGMD
ncbi:Cyclin [Pleurostoma richardsiae]|uniref:Cyclin n=1 Tax=Pleurostoma richardsiae TaxID=41990 RepID=A0AA38VDY2_9PEZI|nr:Cyclin [Pleurostoma richardsiae]